MQSQRMCGECSQISTQYEFFIDLSLELSFGDSVEEALQTYTKVELLSDWKCEKLVFRELKINFNRCNKQAGQKQLTVYRAPNILVITLKRFDMMQGGGKINKSVVFREDLSLQKVMSRNSPVS
jgi:ubiquitin carboxyl-terminal hydrolase 36/42